MADVVLVYGHKLLLFLADSADGSVIGIHVALLGGGQLAHLVTALF